MRAIVQDIFGGPDVLRVVEIDRPRGLPTERFAGVMVEPDYVGLERLAEWVDSGWLRIHVDAAFPMEAAATAHERLEGSNQGKLVLTVT
jgi:NADPH:quinone reductase-like Zn-dependent oxidoreductase